VVSLFSLFLAAGCARTPPGAVRVPARQLLLDLTVAGRIQPNLQYYLALDLDVDPNTGPLPVVGPPWGNGWGTGNITHYVIVRGGQALVFRFRPDTNLLEVDPLGRPFDFRPPAPANPGRVGVTLDLDTLVPPTAQLNTFTYNIITTDITPLDPQFPGPKLVDGFGPTGNDFLQLTGLQSRVFTNGELARPEPPGDVLRVPDRQVVSSASDLDIVDWRVEVRRQ
jgi:hypothetical protein